MTGKVMVDAPTRVSEEEDLDLRSIIPGLSPSQAAVLEKGLAVRAKDRIRSLEELHKLLYPSKKPETPRKPKPPKKPDPPKEPKPPKDPATPGKPFPKLLIAALAVILCVVGIFALLPRNDSTIISTEPDGTFSEATEAQSITVEVQPVPAEPLPHPAPASEITLWTYPIGSWGNEAALAPLLAEFEAETGIRVHVEYLTYTDGDDKVQTAIQAGAAPDLILESPDRIVGKWGDYMVNIRDMFDAEDLSEIYPAVLTACSADENTTCGYPLVMTVHCMAINKTVFEAAGAMKFIDEDTHTWTTTQFRTAMDQVFRYTGVPAGAIYCAGQAGDQGTRALVTNLMGGSYMNEARSVFTWDSPENLTAFKYLHDMPSVQYDVTLVGGEEIALFYNGRLNAAFCWNIAQQLNPNSAETGAERTAEETRSSSWPSPLPKV